MGKKKGFTLVELLVVIAISAIFGMIVLTISVTSSKLFGKTQTESFFNDQARIVISWLEDDLRTATVTTNPAGSVNEVKIGSNTYGSVSNFPAMSEVVLALEIKENGVNEKYAYILKNNTLRKLKLVGGLLKDYSTGIDNVDSCTVKKSGTDSSDRRYFIDINFKNEKGEKAEFNSAITPRN